MIIGFWILLLLFLGLGAWEFFQCRRQHGRIVALEQALQESTQNADAQEEKYLREKAHWDRTEKKLRSFLKLMDTLLNTIPNPIYFKDADGVYQGCNNVFAKQVIGLTRDRIIGKRPQELTGQIPADLAAIYQREEYKMIEKAENHTFESEVRCTDGKRREFLFSLAPVLAPDGAHDGSVAILSDLTDKNRAAQNQLQKEKLEGVLETAGAVCHELNQPLQTLSGYTELLGLKLDGHPERADIELLTAQIERIGHIIDKLQGITRYETTGYSGRTKIIDIHKASDPPSPLPATEQ